MWRALLLAAACAGLAGAAGLWPAGPATPPAPAVAGPDPETPPPPAVTPRSPVSPVPAPTARDRPPPPAERSEPAAAEGVIAPRVRPEAAESLHRARRDGDPRTPPVASREPRVPPPQDVLDDPERYSRYEQGERMAVYASFMDASKRRIGELEELVARGERDGLPPEQLAEGRRKLEGLKARREELLSRFPELAPPD